MTLRADSYGSTGEVKAFTRHLLDGQTAFNSTTRPTQADLDKFIDRTSGVLNIALASSGFAPASDLAGRRHGFGGFHSIETRTGAKIGDYGAIG